MCGSGIFLLSSFNVYGSAFIQSTLSVYFLLCVLAFYSSDVEYVSVSLRFLQSTCECVGHRFYQSTLSE